ncbi:MAG: dynamin family protein [Deltaproteobacteria bacterium]|nr:dynamin family protein [Deltaproteobacteria bacterium]
MGIFDKLGRMVEDAFLLPEELRTALERGEAHLERGELEEAARDLRLVLSERPDHPRVGALYARVLRCRGDLDGALEALARASASDPEDPEVLFELGQARREAGDEKASMEHFKAAAAQLARHGGPAYSRAANALADGHLAAGRPDRAVRELRKAVSATPADANAHLKLGEALVADGEIGAAREALRRAAELEPEPAALARLGEAFLQAGCPSDAEAALRMACLSPDPPPRARKDLARALLEDGDWAGAVEEAAAAAPIMPGDPEPRLIAAEAHARSGDLRAALGDYEAALALDPADPVALRGAIRVAGPVDPARCETIALRLAERLPSDPIVIAGLAHAALARGEVAGASEILSRIGPVGPSSSPELCEVAATASLERGDGEAALEAMAHAGGGARGAWAPADLRDRAARLVATAGQKPDLAVLCERLHRHALTRPELSRLSVEVARVRGELDRPLQLAVMGEFNAGKSTFINALIGEEVAPMGVTPTTATLNVLKYGAERKVRVVHVDDTVREGSYADLEEILAEAALASRSVRRVEILFPAEALLRVNLIDTPGTNALEPEHEKVARRAIEEADAVVWLFRAGQAGKDSERRILGAIRGHRRKTLGVLNQIDRVAPEEVPALVAHLDAELGGTYIEAVGALSARSALRAKLEGDAALLASSGIESLEALLEERFYRHALTLKRQSSAIRLQELLVSIVADEERALASLVSRVASLASQGPQKERLGSALRSSLAAHVDAVERALASLCEQAAAEVDDFVRPRERILARRGFADEDRRFLSELFDERLEALSRQLSSELSAELTGHLGSFASALGALGDVQERLAASAETWTTSALVGFTSFQRGLLSGGSLDRLFSETLRPGVAQGEIARALRALMADPRAHLAPSLERGADRLVALMKDAHSRALGSAEERERRFRARVVDPLRGFALVAAELAA